MTDTNARCRSLSRTIILVDALLLICRRRGRRRAWRTNDVAKRTEARRARWPGTDVDTVNTDISPSCYFFVLALCIRIDDTVSSPSGALTMASPTTLPASATTAAPLQNNLYVSQTDNSVFCLQTVFVIFWVWCCGFVLSFLISSSVMGSIGIAVMAIAIVLLVVGIGQMVRAKKRVRSQAAMLRPMASRLPPFWFSHY